MDAKRNLEWWHSLSDIERKSLLMLARKADPTVIDRLLKDIRSKPEYKTKDVS